VRAYRDALDCQMGRELSMSSSRRWSTQNVAESRFRDPVGQDCVRIEAVKGVGEELVSGNAIPERYQFDLRLLAERLVYAWAQYIEMAKRRLTPSVSSGDHTRPAADANDKQKIAEHVPRHWSDCFPHAVRGSTLSGQ